MSSIADPVDNPIRITRNTNYLYTLPATAGLTSITASGTDFTVSTLNLGRAATLQIKYTAAVAGGPEYHTVDLPATFDDGSTASQTLNFQVYGDATVIPNITNPSMLGVGTGLAFKFPVKIDPVGGGTVGAEDLPGWLTFSNGVVSGTAPSTGSRNLVKLTVGTGFITFKRYIVLVVGDGGDGGGGAIITPPAPGGNRL